MRRIRKFHFDLGCLETYWHSVRNTFISFMLDRNLQTVSFSMLRHFTIRVITCLGVILLDRLVINGIYFYIVCSGKFYNNT